MPFGELFTGTFGQIWRHKRLWLFGLLGLALTSIGLLIYQSFQYRWQGEWYSTMGDMMQNPGQMPDGYFSNMMSTMVWLWLGMGIWLIVGLLGYIINLVMRGATMNEAAIAWDGGRTRTGRGLSVGVGRGVYVFLIDLLWLLPGLLLMCGGFGAFAAVIAAVAAASDGGNEAAGGVFVLTLITVLCCVFCLALFVGLLSMVFAPLMYQSAVAGRRGLGAAISEGWRLARANLGAMIIFAVLLWVLNIALGMLVSLLTFPFMLPWMSSWMQNFSWDDGVCWPRRALADAAVREHRLAVGRDAGLGPSDLAHRQLHAELPADAVCRGLPASGWPECDGRAGALLPADDSTPAPLLAAAPPETETGDAPAG